MPYRKCKQASVVTEASLFPCTMLLSKHAAPPAIFCNCRLRNIASALTYAGHQPPALPSTSSRLNVERVSLAEYLLSELPKQARILTVLGSPVWFWLHGHSRDNSSLPAEKVFSRKAVSAPEQRAFAASFQPSKELVRLSERFLLSTKYMMSQSQFARC
jgi:hypothetical protein